MKAENLVEMVKYSVDRYFDRTALMWKSKGQFESMTYGEFWGRIRNTAAGLALLGVGTGDKVAILSENNPVWPICDLAIMSLGAVSVPVHAALPQDQVAFIINNSECKAVIVQNDALLRKVSTAETGVLFIIVMEPDEGHHDTGQVFTYEILMKMGGDHPLQMWEEMWKHIDRMQLATIIHTSGTTGHPKGAMLTHGNILSNVEGVQFWVLEARPTDVLLSHLPLSHVFERMAGQFVPLSAGSAIAYAESMEKVSENLLEVRPTVLVSVPLLLEKVYTRVQEKIEAGTPLRRKIFSWALGVGMKRYEGYVTQSVDEIMKQGSVPKALRRKWALANWLVYKKVKKQLGGRLRGLISGGGALSPEIGRFFWAIDLPALEGYGLTETSPVIAANPMIRTKVGTVGKILPNLEMRLAPDGEVMVRGPSVMTGYYNNEKATREAFRDGWLLTGDLGKLDGDGFLSIVDRKKRIIVLKTGKNVAPQPVENAINLSSYIENCVLIGQNQKYVIVLVTPDFSVLVPWAKKRGWPDHYEAIVRNEEVQKLLRREVDERTKKFPRYEQPKKVVILGDEWTTGTGELTPSLKVRLPVIEEKYKNIIKKVYAEEHPVAASSAADEIAVGLTMHQSGRDE
ncbi:AMP-dependent synthetase/ligase [Fictibacillus terranigra]|uniref:Long-chain fatty acid--CoA ligase n=1 Tax=Fictibacillus terranigra TaxID=3058424 RepID=A0ABT8E954_9BACL|nr:long-chain fatty acid--CoA ligase [Fictibacillus sp. CENA-BCM004]MDN4074441.1 long-chain fatty acid--CoA ligase [Fictibacillus sp. CENA-BCM004]